MRARSRFPPLLPLILTLLTVGPAPWNPSAPPGTALAITANPRLFNYTQPDGTKAEIRMVGDASYHYLTDASGYTCVEDADGYMVYAQPSQLKGGDLLPTSLRCARDDPATLRLGRHAKPPSAVRRARCGEYCQSRPERNRRKMEDIATGETSRRLSADGSGGTLKNLVILMRFADHVGRAVPSKEDVATVMNHPGTHPTLATTGSVAHALREFSYGALNFESVVWDWVTLPFTEAQYAGGNMGLSSTFHRALVDALSIHNAAGANFKDFDVKEAGGGGDGFIDSILFMHSGYGAEFGLIDCHLTSMSNRIWSHEWELSSPPGGWTSHDGVTVKQYPVNSAMYGDGIKDGCDVAASGAGACCEADVARIGSLTHEMYHFFGLGDFYDTEGGYGIGSFGIMANAWGMDNTQKNPPQLSPFAKHAFGWMETREITSGGTYTLGASWNTPLVYKITLGDPNQKEYLLIENKFRASFEKSLLQDGLIIWHVDCKAPGNENEGYPGQAGWPQNGMHYMLAVTQADGRYELEKGVNEGDGTDPFQGCFVDELAPSIDPVKGPFPNTDYYSPQGNVGQTGIRIHDISRSGQEMTFQVTTGYTTPSRNNPHGSRRLYGPFNGMNMNSGAMFDIVAHTDIRITKFDVRLRSGSPDAPFKHNMIVFKKDGTHFGSEKDPKAWTHIGNMEVQARGPNCKAEVSGFDEVAVPKGQRVAFYLAHTENVQSMDDLKLMYSNGQATSPKWYEESWFENEDLTVCQGTGQGFPIHPNNQNTFPARNFDGIVHYEYGLEPQPIKAQPSPTPAPNHCSPNPCQNGGTCNNGLNGYTCSCPAGFSGTNCETNINECASNPCKNGGTCTDGNNGYTCSCPAGFSGTNCETNINECASNPCKNGGTCKDGNNGYTCQCPAGFSGTNCDGNVDDCASNPCQNGGTCIDGVSRYTCSCPAGFSGTNCETNINECASNPCKNGGTCKDGNNGYVCSCIVGFSGTNCETNINDCASNPCKNGGACIDIVNGFTCECVEGFSGATCENDYRNSGPTDPILVYSHSFDDANNQAKGNMFDVTALRSLEVKAFSVHISSAGLTAPVSIYTKIGTFQGFETNLGAWTKICDVDVVSQGPNQPTKIEASMCSNTVKMQQGATHGFYFSVDSTSPVHMLYTTGSSIGDIVNRESNWAHVRQGVGKGEDIANTYGARIWNGQLYCNEQ